ncbi:hypothetical protein [Methanofollis sp. UBA420]|jgi:uncharacterized protein (UPF0332 family)|uniref:hypothetical protein n=1 Tax=Methanofollis sp. UBA420 TaxID=1915514 RepID=UPI00316ADCD7
MIFSWSQFVEIAEHLKKQGDDNLIPQEAAYRCSVSRAYYGAYRHAQNYAKDTWGYVPEIDGTDHKNLRERFKGENMADIARHLSRLHQWRKDCDYNEPFQKIVNVSSCVRDSISEAHQIINALK